MNFSGLSYLTLYFEWDKMVELMVEFSLQGLYVQLGVIVFL